MAQSGLPRGRSWSAGTGSLSASSRWVRNERCRELSHLEQEAKKILKVIEAVELEIHDRSVGLEKLKKRDSQRVQKIADLSRALINSEKPEETHSGEERVNGDSKKTERKPHHSERSGEIQEQLVRLKRDHAGTEGVMEEAKATLEHKRRELERLLGQHHFLCEQIAEEEQSLQAAEMEESLQQSVAVQKEMRSLSEDLGRLGRLMEDLKEPSSDHLKQQITMRHQKHRVYHGITSSRGTRSVSRSSHNGAAAPDHSHHLPSLRDHSSTAGRNKEPAEFEEKEGSNRKRHKNSSFEAELERLHEQKERLESEAQEKQMLLESVARFSQYTLDAEVNRGASARTTTASKHPIASPSPLSDALEESPSPGPPRTGSTGSSASSGLSSDHNDGEKLHKAPSPPSAAKRLDFKAALSAEGTGERSGMAPAATDEEEKFEFEGPIVRKHDLESELVEKEKETETQSSCSDVTEDEVLSSAHGLNEVGRKSEESCPEAGVSCCLKEEEVAAEEATDGATSNRGREIDKDERCTDQHRSFSTNGEGSETGGGEEALRGRNGVGDLEGLGDGENCHGNWKLIGEAIVEDDQSDKCNETGRTVEKSDSCKEEETMKEEINASPFLGPQFAHPQMQHDDAEQAELATGLQIAPEAERLQAQDHRRDDADEHKMCKLKTESQIMQLSSQLSRLKKQVEHEMERQHNGKSDQLLEHLSGTTEQLGEQVGCFSNEISDLKHSINEMQQTLLNEGQSRSSMEHWAEHHRSLCNDQSAKLEHLETQVSLLVKELNEQLSLRADLEWKLDKELEERRKFEAQLMNLSQAVSATVSIREKEGEVVGEIVEQQKHLLVDQLKEAEKLRSVAEVRVVTLDKQVEQLEMVCDVTQNIQKVLKCQEKVLRYGLQTLVQLFLLAIGVVTLYSRVSEPMKGSLIPT